MNSCFRTLDFFLFTIVACKPNLVKSRQRYRINSGSLLPAETGTFVIIQRFRLGLSSTLFSPITVWARNYFLIHITKCVVFVVGLWNNHIRIQNISKELWVQFLVFSYTRILKLNTILFKSLKCAVFTKYFTVYLRSIKHIQWFGHVKLVMANKVNG